MTDWAAITSTLLLCCVLYLGRRAIVNRNTRPLPPGPPGLPWIGNVTGIDISAPWTTYAEWARSYGDIVYSRLMGKDIIIINSEKIAKDLFEKRSGNYSDRPQLVANEMLGLGFHTSLMSYGNRWRLHRRFFHQTFRLDAMSRFKHLQHHKACHLLKQLFSRPEHLEDYLFEYTASLSLNSTYAYDPASRRDDMVDIMANVLDVIVTAVRPEISILVSAFPFLLYLPSWLPGMSFKKKMEMARAATKEYVERPFEYSLRKMEMDSNSIIAPSMVFDGLQTKEEEESLTWMVALKEAAAASFVAASETTHAALLTVFFFLMLNPDAQEKAQAEIDTVVGRHRLPSIDDRPLLPFVEAVFREILRHCPVLPLLIPHVSGRRLLRRILHPEGSMAHDASRYPNPHAFIPERFLNDDGSLKPNDVEHITFGFGRRMCPAKHFADTSVWGAMVRFLAVFKILKPLDEHGVEITVEPKFSSGLVIHPLPFKYRIVPRIQGLDEGKLEELIVASTN